MTGGVRSSPIIAGKSGLVGALSSAGSSWASSFSIAAEVGTEDSVCGSPGETGGGGGLGGNPAVPGSAGEDGRAAAVVAFPQ